MKSFCLSCGTPTEYTLAKPTKCKFCGQAFASVVPLPPTAPPPPSRPPPQPVKQSSRIFADEDESQETQVDINSVSADGFDIEVVKMNATNKTTMENLLTQGTPCFTRDAEMLKGPKGKKMSKAAAKKQFLEDFAKEAGAIRPQSKTHTYTKPND